MKIDFSSLNLEQFRCDEHILNNEKVFWFNRNLPKQNGRKGISISGRRYGMKRAN